MWDKLKPIRPYLIIPPLIIIGANLAGLLSHYIVAFLARLSATVMPVLADHSWIAVLVVAAFLTFFLSHLISRTTVLAHHRVDIEFYGLAGRRFTIIRLIAGLILLFIGLCLLLLVCVLLYELLAALYHSWFFTNYNFFCFLVIVVAILQFVLRTDTLRSLTWKKLSGIWLKPPAVGAITVGGFTFIATSDAIKNRLIQFTLDSPYTHLAAIVPATIISVLLMAIAIITERVGRSKAPDEEGNIPVGWFYTAFGFAFASNVLMFSLLLTSVFLTVNSHYTMPQNGT